MTVFLLQSENLTRWGNAQFLVFHLQNCLHPPFTCLLVTVENAAAFHGSVLRPPMW